MVPLTHVRTPEEVTGVKSPDPENWTVPIESSERLQWSGVNTTDKDAPPPSGMDFFRICFFHFSIFTDKFD